MPISPPLALAALLLAVCLTAPAAAAPVDTVQMLSSDVRIVMHLDASQLMSRPWVNGVVERVARLPRLLDQLNALETQYGIDPLRAVGDLTIAFPDRSRTGLPLWIVGGDIDAAKVLMGAKKAARLMTRKRAGHQYYTAPDGTGLAFVGERTLVGDRALLERTLSAVGKKRGPRDPAFRRLLKQIDRHKAAWFVGSISSDVRRQLSRRAPILGSLKAIRGVVDVTKGGRLDVWARLDPNDAQKIVARVQADLAQMRGSAMVKIMGLDLLIDRLVLRAEGEELTLTLRLTEAEATRLQAALAMVASALIAGQLSRPSVRSPPPGQRIRRARGKEK
jgi:hypothetical protein